MGKKNFKKIYEKVKNDNGGKVTCKISYYSSDYKRSSNYAGVIVYGMDGRSSWKVTGGQANDQNGKAFYVVMRDTEGIRPNPQDGIVHWEPAWSVLGIQVPNERLLCGGFAYDNNTLKFNSYTFNCGRQQGLDGSYDVNDSSNAMSAGEQELVKYCWEKYKANGKHQTFEIPSDVEKRIIGGSSWLSSLFG